MGIAILYMFPRTVFPGAVLPAGYFGAAIADLNP
jgi:hypothetical protein